MEMDKLHHLASGGDAIDADDAYENEDDFQGSEMGVDFMRATGLVAKEGLREGLAHGKELDMQKVRKSISYVAFPNGMNSCVYHRCINSVTGPH